MRYDLKLIADFGIENDFQVVQRGPESVGLDLGGGAVLEFCNSEKEENSLIGFAGTTWHTHGKFMFAGQRGYFIEMDYLDVLVGLSEGTVLLCERRIGGQLRQRQLIHRDYNHEFHYLAIDDEIVVRCASRTGSEKHGR